MNKQEFLQALGKGLSGLPYAEQDKWIDFYGEMIDDRVEEGLSEEEAVAAVGSVEEIIQQILSQTQPEVKKKKQQLKTWQLVMLIVGSPLWFALLVAVASVVFSLLVAAWVVVIVFYAVAVSLIACSLAGVALMLLYIFKGNPLMGVFCLGAGLFCAGLGIFWFIATHYMTKGVVCLCKKLFAALFHRKEAAA